ncbi:MAG TPA: YggT family protein [Gemmatimonadaceae bacterium]|nr:YggT family protein [Gemmatimonadaceae bacterium]
MNSLIAGVATLYVVLRTTLLVSAVLLAAVATIDWAVRTRRLNPFSRVARFFRGTVDPVIAPVERRVLRAGGNPVHAPWWALAAVVLLGIVLLSLIQFLAGQMRAVFGATQGGVRGILLLLVGWAFALLQLAIIVRVVASWVGGSPFSPWWRWAFTISEPLLRPLRRIIPSLGPIDITPIVAWFVLSLLRPLVLRAMISL